MPSSVPPQPPPHTPSGRSGSTGGGTPTGRGALPSPLDAGFDAIDTNKDGVITEDELMAAVIRPLTATPPRATPPRVLSESPSRAAAVSGGSRRKSANAADLDIVARI